jgi:hypothetical protein
MFTSTVSRRGIARTLSTLVAVALTVTVGVLSANGAAATAGGETPQNVTAVVYSQADNTALVVVNWDALVDEDSVSAIDISLTGQGSQSVPSGTTGGAGFSGVAPGDYTAAVAFEYTDSSPTSADVAIPVTVAPVAAPDAVSDVHGRANGTDVTVSWTPAQDVDGNPTGAPYDHYTVTLGAEDPSDVPAGYSDKTFTGIAPGTYDLEVDAVNALHTTVATGSITVTGATVADAPDNLIARDLADGTVGVFWDAPASDGGNEITDYQIVLSFPNGDLDEWDNYPVFTAADPPSGAKRDAAFVGMPFDQGDYIVTVKAINASGEGPAASTGLQPMVHSTVPDAPHDVAATSPDLNSVAVTWTPPASDGGQPVDEYDVTLGEETRSTDGDGRDVTFDGVEAGTYTAAVTAHNSNGSSESSSALVTVDGDSSTGSGQAAPTHLHASRVTEGGVTTIKWRAPEGVGLYLLFVDGRPYIVGPRKTEKTVHGLRAGPAKVKLYALSENGFSKAPVITIHVKKSVAQAPKESLKLGMHGPDVRHLQKALFMRHPSGTFGKGTRAAVIEWQGFYGRHRTGEVNDRMRYLLNV